MARYSLIFLAGLLAAFLLWGERAIARPPGVLVPGDPHQEILDDGPRFEIAGYNLRALARFEIEARVLSAERYRFDRGADLSPVDLALGWGPMSANEVIDSLEISQGGRFYQWWSQEPALRPGEISRHSANMHMVPLDSEARARLLDARRGNLVRVSGWLVEARADDGWKWRSSLSRSDTGPGACELVLVETIELD